jgi:hypothetical protein
VSLRELALVLDRPDRLERTDRVLPGVGCVELERVEQLRQELANVAVASEHQLPVALVRWPGELADLLDRPGERFAADASEDLAPQPAVVDRLIEDQRARVGEP